jgi:polyhydroxybutyrate depolymerase
MLGAATLGAPASLPAQTVEEGRRTLEMDGLRRTYLLHLPPSRRPGRPVPLLFVFHGASGDGGGIARHTGLTEAAHARGYAVVYPDGVDRRWNDGRGARATRDDVGFVRLLIDSLRRELPADPRRIYATGISNGAGLALRLACDLPGTFAAIASVAGALAAGLEERCAASAPVSVLMLHGTGDGFIPYDGGVLTRRRGRVLPAPRTAALFARLDGCADQPVLGVEPDTVHDGTSVRRSAYPGCAEGREVVLYTIEGGGHTWPGGPPVGRSVGRVTRDLRATPLILDFFDGHALSSSPGASR